MLIFPPKKSDYFSITRKNTHTLPVSSERASTHSVDKGKIWCVENCRQEKEKGNLFVNMNLFVNIFEEFRQHCSERCKKLIFTVEKRVVLVEAEKRFRSWRQAAHLSVYQSIVKEDEPVDRESSSMLQWQAPIAAFTD